MRVYDKAQWHIDAGEDKNEVIKKFKAVFFAAIALFLYLFGYRHAKETAEKEQLKGENNALKIAKKARNSLSNPAVVDRLHKKYRR